MISIRDILRASVVQEAMLYGSDQKPVYARLPDGSLHQIDAVREGQIMTSAGAHDIIVVEVSELTSEEA